MITIPEMLARNARMYPDDCALVELKPGKKYRNEITWKVFDQQANRVANMLLDMGVGKGDKVIHWMMNSIDWLVAYFGILRTGAWVVPLNFRFTAQDFKFCADISEAKVMIVGEEFIERVDSVKSQLGYVQRYIGVSHSVPGYMSDYHSAMKAYPDSPSSIELYDERAAACISLRALRGRPSPFC